MTLNSITAERYTVETVHGARVISSAISCYPESDGSMVYTVPFRLPDAGVSDIFRMDVWIDVDGRIYGEW